MFMGEAVSVWSLCSIWGSLSRRSLSKGSLFRGSLSGRSQSGKLPGQRLPSPSRRVKCGRYASNWNTFLLERLVPSWIFLRLTFIVCYLRKTFTDTEGNFEVRELHTGKRDGGESEAGEHPVRLQRHLSVMMRTLQTFICLTSVTRAKCGIRSTLCWKILNISGSNESFAL